MRRVMMKMVVIAGAAGGAAGLTAGAAAAATVEVTLTGTVATVDDGNNGYAQNSYWNGALAAGDAFTAKYVFDTTRGETRSVTDDSTGAVQTSLYGGTGSGYAGLSSPLLSATVQLGGRLIDLTTDYDATYQHITRGFSGASSARVTYMLDFSETDAGSLQTAQMRFDVIDFFANAFELSSVYDAPYEVDLTTDYWSSLGGDDPLPLAQGHFFDNKIDLTGAVQDYYTYVQFNPTHVRVTSDAVTPAPVPLPASALLLAGGLGLMGAARRRRIAA